MTEIICNEECTQYIKGYCTIPKFGIQCGKQKFAERPRFKNNYSRKPYRRSSY